MTNVGESQNLELRRSSRAKVSQGVAAIDRDRARAVEFHGRVTQDMAERNVKGAANMGRGVLVRRKHVDDLRGAVRARRGELAMSNLAHGYARIAASVESAVSTIVSPLPAAIRAVSTS